MTANADLWIFAAGLALGFPIGVMFDDALDLYRASRKERTVKSDFQQMTGTRAGLTGLLAVLVVLNFGVGLLLITTRVTAQVTAADLAVYSACTSRWQQEFANAYKARYDSSLPVSDALDEIVEAVAADDIPRMNRAIANYLKVREQQKVERAATPLPPLPEQLCGMAPTPPSNG